MIRSGVAAPLPGASRRLQYYAYNTNPQRWSNELRLSSKPGGRLHWLAGSYWQRTTDKNYNDLLHAESAVQRVRPSSTPPNYYGPPSQACRPGSGTRTPRPRISCRPPSSRTSISMSPTSSTSRRAWCISTTIERYDTPYFSFAYGPNTPSDYTQSSHKVDGKAGISYKLTDHSHDLRRLGSGFPPGGLELRTPVRTQRLLRRRCAVDLHSGHAQQLRDRMEDDQPAEPPAVERRRLLHGLEGSAGAHLQRAGMRLLELQRQCRRRPHLRCRVEHRLPHHRQPDRCRPRSTTRRRVSPRHPTRATSPTSASGCRSRLISTGAGTCATSTRSRAAARLLRSSTWPTRATCTTASIPTTSTPVCLASCSRRTR